ncbi:hypothetical protein XENOCAPTIV_031042 [Xenoophorus captivus]|uniref:Sestrin 1 n=1 Tax=Xenoophorus captivus TaxID=1517983 RepID=A0ABV0RMV7_9TELE
MSRRGRYSAEGAATADCLPATFPHQCPKEQRLEGKEPFKLHCFYSLLRGKKQRRNGGNEMRHAIAPSPNVENNSIAVTDLFKICTHCERLTKKAIFEDAFAALHRLDNVSLVMSFHPQYLGSFLRTQHYLLQMDGPLPLHYRHYICIMAAARHQCSYLVNLHVNDFLQVGGNSKWLNGLNEAPQKLQQLGEINKILAHRPWLLTKEHIEEMCGEVEELMERMKQLQECRDDEEASQEEMATRFEKEKTESMLVVMSEDEECVPSRDISRHFEDTSYGYQDFSRRGEQVPTFRAQDYSWEDHGFSLVNRLYPDVGQMLDEKFQMAYNLTYNTMATHKDVDTSMLRRAIWNYIHCMFGIRALTLETSRTTFQYFSIACLTSLKIGMRILVKLPQKESCAARKGLHI